MDTAALTEIREVAERYFNAVDGSDGELMASCFARTFRFELDMKPTQVMTTHDEVRGFLNQRWRPAASTHTLGNMHIVLDGDSATSTINANVHVYNATTQTIWVRGLRYTDRWVREDGRWLIAERVHKLRWHFEHPAGEMPDA